MSKNRLRFPEDEATTEEVKEWNQKLTLMRVNQYLEFIYQDIDLNKAIEKALDIPFDESYRELAVVLEPLYMWLKKQRQRWNLKEGEDGV